MDVMPKNNITSYIIQSQEEEIKRIALELHEGVGQQLYSLLTGLHFLDTSAQQSNVKDMSQMLEKIIQEIRLLSVELHPPSLTTLGLVPAVKSYAKLYTSTYGIEVDIKTTGVQKNISEHTSIALFRVCQEALLNTAKYADTSNATITFTWKESELAIEIVDYGKGFDSATISDSFSGLGAMKERMYLVGGACSIISKINQGTSIIATLPLA